MKYFHIWIFEETNCGFWTLGVGAMTHDAELTLLGAMDHEAKLIFIASDVAMIWC